ncbi:MAG: HNH endonuclease [Candidatus Brocadia sp.]
MTWITWDSLRRQQQPIITRYKLLTIEVDGDLHDIINVFIQINSTGKALTTAEKQHAKYYNSEFLKTAAKVASKYEDYFVRSGIISAGQITRMKHIELICEIMISIGQGEVINKKAALDKVMATTLTSIQIKKVRDKTITAINRLQKIFPLLCHTRFRQLSDFYVLTVLIAKYEAEKLILTDKQRNKLAWDLLVNFSNGVDCVRMKQKKAEGISEGEEMYREYLLTVLHNTDEISQRRKREQILDGLLHSLFEKRDSQRIFSLEQRRLIWNTSEEKKCEVCKKNLTWEDFTIDHIDPHSKGGRTALENVALMCRTHNSSKGNRRC